MFPASLVLPAPSVQGSPPALSDPALSDVLITIGPETSKECCLRLWLLEQIPPQRVVLRGAIVNQLTL